MFTEKALSQAIDIYKEKCGIDTDTDLAHRFGVSKQSISQARRRGNLSDEHCEVIAEKTGINLAYLLACRNSMRTTGKIQRAWETLCESMHTEAARTTNLYYRKCWAALRRNLGNVRNVLKLQPIKISEK